MGVFFNHKFVNVLVLVFHTTSIFLTNSGWESKLLQMVISVDQKMKMYMGASKIRFRLSVMELYNTEM